jgi:lipopolysaccharide export LptBFGC system permease protein LptF
VRGLEAAYYSRWALTFAPFVLALFALSVARHRSVSRLTLVVAGLAACFAYYVVLYLARSLGLSGEIPTVLVAWLPNVVMALVAVLITITSTRCSELTADLSGQT